MRYFRQALALIREERLFSGIYIVGTALAIAFTMVMAVVYYIKLAPIYPERNRARTIYFEGLRVEAADGNGMGQTNFSSRAIKEWFQASPNIEYCSPTLLAAGTGKTLGRCHTFVVKGKDDYIDIVRNEVSADYFKIYEFDFLSGRPLTAQEVAGEEQVCVVSDALAERLFGRGVDAVGRTVQMETGRELRVVGMVRGGSQLAPDSYADLFTTYWKDNDQARYTGLYSVVATVKDDGHLQALRRELDDVAARFSESHQDLLPFSFGQDVKKRLVLTRALETHPMHVLNTENRDSIFKVVSPWQLVRHYAGLLFVLLFVPALNLCGIVAGRMERRSAEIAVRKTFGARRSTLLNQVVMENLVLTAIGGIIGFVLSWLAIYGLRREILGMFFDNSTLSTAPIVEGEMLFAPTLFAGAFAAIVVLNLLAAVMPAWWSLRKPIVESMMEKR